jgi:hypothetical protein
MAGSMAWRWTEMENFLVGQHACIAHECRFREPSRLVIQCDSEMTWTDDSRELRDW